MKYDMQYATCKNCVGIDKCNRGCMLHLGKAFVDFINRVDVIETKIGDFDSRVKGTKSDLVVSGHEIQEIKSPIWILTDISTILDGSNKFKDAYGKTIIQIVNNYCRYIGMDLREIKEITDRIRAVNANRLFILPFKPHTECVVEVAPNGRAETKKDAKLFSLKWSTNKDTHKINCRLTFELEAGVGSSYVRCGITEYLDKFRLTQMDLNLKATKNEVDLIKVTDYGIIKPLAVKDGNTCIAVDGTYVYYTTGAEVHIIGYWNTKDKIVLTSSIKSKALDKIMDNEEFIKCHKKYMAPYLSHEPNMIIL